MAWEDCVVDIHSVKLPPHILESMFSKCGAVQRVIHWKGQGDKQHVFVEYKSPISADSARVIGLDRNDIQVIKLSNNEMLKRKFRELEKQSVNRTRLGRPDSDRNVSTNVNSRRLPAKPAAPFPYAEVHTSEGPRDIQPRSMRHRPGRDSSASLSNSLSNSTGRGGSIQKNSSRNLSFSLSKTSTPPLPDLTLVPNSTMKGASDLCSRFDAGGEEVGDGRLNGVFFSELSQPPHEASTGSKRVPSTALPSQTVLEIPHAGEVIKFDLDKQLENNPAGIIRMLSTVNADQKLWMMTAAHYNGKNNLEAAKEVLEAGIDMAVQAGKAADTRPFWHLLNHLNSSLKTASSGCLPGSSSPATSIPTLVENTVNQISGEFHPEPLGKSTTAYLPMNEKEQCLPDNIHHANPVTSDMKNVSPIQPAVSPPLHQSPTSFQPHAYVPLPTLRIQELQPPPASTSSISLSAPTDSMPSSHSLQREISTLREKQKTVLQELSAMRAAKRRAEDEVKEGRFVRRKLEKSLRAAEDALARSKRMEDAALSQVKREVEARRKAEELLSVARARSDGGGGTSLFVRPGTNDAAMLFQLASLLRSVSSGDISDPSRPSSIGATAMDATSSSVGGSSRT